jgi:hypothetical protein
VTYEPGTADILTTCDPPSPPDVESAVLRAVFERAANAGYAIVKVEDGQWYMQIDWTRITDNERHILTRIAVAAP